MLPPTAAALWRLIPPLIQRRCMLHRQISAIHSLTRYCCFHPTANQKLFLECGYAKMARRIPPVRPDKYSESESESEEKEDEMEMSGDESADWEGFMLDFGSRSDNDRTEGEEE